MTNVKDVSKPFSPWTISNPATICILIFRVLFLRFIHAKKNVGKSVLKSNHRNGSYTTKWILDLTYLIRNYFIGGTGQFFWCLIGFNVCVVITSRRPYYTRPGWHINPHGGNFLVVNPSISSWRSRSLLCLSLLCNNEGSPFDQNQVPHSSSSRF